MPGDGMVTLNAAEMRQGLLCGGERQIANLMQGRQDRYGADPASGWNLHITGALAEVAAAKYLGRHWEGMGALDNFKASDVKGVEVRWSGVPYLILHERDKDDLPYLLVTGLGPSFTLRGWKLGADGKDQRYWGDPYKKNRPAFFIPVSELDSMRLLTTFLKLDDESDAKAHDRPVLR
jgi:hypothetical protein